MYVVCMYVYRRLIFSLQTVNKPLLFYISYEKFSVLKFVSLTYNQF